MRNRYLDKIFLLTIANAFIWRYLTYAILLVYVFFKLTVA